MTKIRSPQSHRSIRLVQNTNTDSDSDSEQDRARLDTIRYNVSTMKAADDSATKETLPIRSHEWNADFHKGKYEGQVESQQAVFSQGQQSEEDVDSGSFHMDIEDEEHEDDLERIRQQLANDEHLLNEGTTDPLVGSLAAKRRAEIRKAQHVNRQKLLWENILKLRISLQKPLTIANQLPVPSKRAQQDEDLGQQLRTTLHQLLSLQNALLDSFTTGSNKQGKAHADSVEEFDDENLNVVETINTNKEMGDNLDSVWNLVKHSYQRWKILREKSINTWHRKTQGVSSQKSLKSINADATDQVSRQLKQVQKLIRHTQVKRFSGSVLGKRKRVTSELNTVTYDPEIFDDRDFYQSLLSNLIQENGTQSNGSVSREQPRKKQKTGSKRRQLQYVTVPELVGFMARQPKKIPPATSALFNGIFGKPRIQDNVNTFDYMSDEDGEP